MKFLFLILLQFHLLSSEEPLTDKNGGHGSTAHSTVDVVIKPEPISLDSTTLGNFSFPIPIEEGTRLEDWRDLGRLADKYDVSLNFLTHGKFWTHERFPYHDPYPTWRDAFDAITRDTHEIWRLRDKAVEFLPHHLERKLNTELNGENSPAGTRTQILAWFAVQAGFTCTLHRALSNDDNRLYTWAPQIASNEAWLNSLTNKFNVTAVVSAENTIVFFPTPSKILLDNDPEWGPLEPRLVYHKPPPTHLDNTVSFVFNDTPFIDAVAFLEQKLGYPIEVDPKSKYEVISLQVKDMKFRIALHWISKIADLKIVVLSDRVLLVPNPDN